MLADQYLRLSSILHVIFSPSLTRAPLNVTAHGRSRIGLSLASPKVAAAASLMLGLRDSSGSRQAFPPPAPDCEDLLCISAKGEKKREREGREKKRNTNSRSLMQTVKNNNQKCSIREMRSPRLWVLQDGCTVITSPEDLGEESFHEKTEGEDRRGRRSRRSAGTAVPLLLRLLLEAKFEC